MKIAEYLKKNRLIADGAMGTYFAAQYPQKGEFAETANLSCPACIKKIHLQYIKSGARLIRTNTFAANTMFFDHMDTVKRLIRAGWQIAEQAAEESGEEVFVAADIGPVYDPQFLGREQILAEYYEICDVFLSCGAEIFVLETQSEFTYAEDVAEYLKKKKDVFVIVQFSVDKNGYTRSGLGMERIVQQAADSEYIDAYGFNCGVGAAHLKNLLEKAAFPNEKYLTALPNAGYPVELRGKTIFRENRKYFVEMMGEIAELGIDIAGGCCGTTPEYIEGICSALSDKPPVSKKIKKAGAQKARSLAYPAGKLFCRKEKVCIVELDPPFDTHIEKVMQGAALLKKAGVDLLTLADSPMARSRMDAGKLAAKVQSEAGISVMPHICCRDKNVIAMRSGILGDYMNGLRYFLVVTGDPVGRNDKGIVTPVFDFNSIRFMEYLAEMNADVFAEEAVCYAGALNYHGANMDAIVKRVKQKMEKGCSAFLTQPVYSEEDIERIAYIKKKTGARMMCGIMPLVSYKNAMFIANEMTGIHVPEDVIQRYRPEMTREEGEQAGIALAVWLAEALEETADGYYFMTPFNRAGMIAEAVRFIKGKETLV